MESSLSSRSLPGIRYPGFSGGDFPGFADMHFERFVANLIQYNANPSARADIRRFEIHFRRIADQGGLKTCGRRQPDGGSAVPVVIFREPGEHAFVLLYKKRG